MTSVMSEMIAQMKHELVPRILAGAWVRGYMDTCMMSSSGVKVHHHSFCCLGLLAVRLVRGRKSATIENKQYPLVLYPLPCSQTFLVSKTRGEGGKGESEAVVPWLAAETRGFSLVVRIWWSLVSWISLHTTQHNNDSAAIHNISVSLLPLHNAAWVTAAGI